MAGRKKKRYSMRGKMITVNMGIMLGALLLCGSIFVFSVFLLSATISTMTWIFPDRHG